MIRFNDVHAVKLISSAARLQFVPMLHHCIAEYDENDYLKGGVMFTDFWGRSLMIHMAGFRPNWVSRSLLYLTFHYPFEQLKVQKLIAAIPEWNVRSRNMTLHIGFKIEYTVPCVFNVPPGTPDGMYIMSMMKEDCKWLHMKKPFISYAPAERTNRIEVPPPTHEIVTTLQ